MGKTYYFQLGEDTLSMETQNGVKISKEDAKKGICAVEWTAEVNCTAVIKEAVPCNAVTVNQKEVETKTRVKVMRYDKKTLLVLDLEKGDKVGMTYPAAESKRVTIQQVMSSGKVKLIYQSEYNKGKG